MTVVACPPIEATLTAPSSLVSSTSSVASVPAIDGATYDWVVTNGAIVSGSGMRSITFQAGCSGTVGLDVTITSSCASRTFSETVSIVPFEATLSGPADPIAQGASAQLAVTLTGAGPWDLTWSDGTVENNVAAWHERSVTPSQTMTYALTNVTDGGGCTGTRTGSVTVTVMPPAPTAVSALAVSASQVNVSWSFSGSKDTFEVYRSGVKIGSTAATSYVDATAAAGTTYLYQVRAVKGGTPSELSGADLATTIVFEDDPLVPVQTKAKAVHLTQLRDAVNAVRRAAGLANGVYTDTIEAGTTLIRAVHLEELGTALNQARTALGFAPVVFARRPLQNAIVSAADVNELRGGVK